MKKSILNICIGLALAIFFLGIPTQISAQSNQPTLLKRTINVKLRRLSVYWKSPTAKEPVYNTFSWVPIINFDVLGPITSGSQIYVEFDSSDGKPWLTYRMRTPELENDYFDSIKMEGSESDFEKNATLATGLFPFRVKMKNALNGTDTTLFSGKYKVSTFVPNQAIPENTGKKEFYVDQDWRLPVAYLWLDPNSNKDTDAPIFSSLMWFRNTTNSDMKIEAFLLYNGKQVADLTVYNEIDSLAPLSNDEPPYRWTLWRFEFLRVRGFNHSANEQSGWFVLEKNPGNYELKVLRNNQLARSIKFSVGADGKIVDPGITKQNKIGGVRMIFPVQIIGAADGAWNKIAWQTEAFYGNPLAGFTAIQ